MQITTSTSCTPIAPAMPGASVNGGAEPGAFAQILGAHQPAARSEAQPEAARDRGQDDDSKPTPPDDARRAQAARRAGPSTPSRDTRTARDVSGTDTATNPESPTPPTAKGGEEDEDTAVTSLAANGHAGPHSMPPEAWTAHGTAPGEGMSPLEPDAGESAPDTAALTALSAAAARADASRRHASPTTDPSEPATRTPRGVEGFEARAESFTSSELTAGSPRAEAATDVASADRRGHTLETFSLAGAAAIHGAPSHEPPPSSLTPTSVDIPTPATAPEFRQALGVQVSVLAREGVQHAELHLNPADMGPISVHIALEGSRAHVDFGADSSATRSLIESGLPELAAALREAGFTLSGGGVSQHARQQHGDLPPGPRAPGAPATSAPREAAPQRITVRVAQGAVDLYA